MSSVDRYEVAWWAYLSSNVVDILEYIDKQLGMEVSRAVAICIRELTVITDREGIERVLQMVWDRLPDDPSIRTDGFNKLCDLLDGGYTR